MVKDKELCALSDELHKCGDILKEISEKLKEAMESKTEAQETEAEKELTLEDVRAVLAEKSRNGFTKEIKEILEKHGANKLSEVDPKEYSQLLKEVEVIGNAG
ncbi:TPA: rRNA biogenesis protein rrp5 [Streptococcus pyogenes]